MYFSSQIRDVLLSEKKKDLHKDFFFLKEKLRELVLLLSHAYHVFIHLIDTKQIFGRK